MLPEGSILENNLKEHLRRKSRSANRSKGCIKKQKNLIFFQKTKTHGASTNKIAFFFFKKKTEQTPC